MEKSADAKVDKGASKVDPDDFYANLRYNIVPPAFLVFFTFITQILVVIGNPDLTFGFGFIFSFFTASLRVLFSDSALAASNLDDLA